MASKSKGALHVREGLADSGRMIRIDIYETKNGYVGVPIYVSDKARSKLPKAYPKKGEDRANWPEVDTNDNFLFSLYSTDWIEAKTKKETIAGYVKSYDIFDGRLLVYAHDNKKVVRKLTLSALADLQKLHVSILGDLYKGGTPKCSPLRKGQEL